MHFILCNALSSEYIRNYFFNRWPVLANQTAIFLCHIHFHINLFMYINLYIQAYVYVEL